MTPLRLTAAVLATVATVCLVLVQFLPWAGLSFDGGAFGSADQEAYTWEAKTDGSFGGFSGSDSSSWYSDDVEDDTGGVDDIRMAIPMLLAGLVVVALGAILTFALRGSAGSIVTLVGALVFAAGTIFFAMGVDKVFDSDQAWAASFYLAIVGGSLALVAGVLGLAAGNRSAA